MITKLQKRIEKLVTNGMGYTKPRIYQTINSELEQFSLDLNLAEKEVNTANNEEITQAVINYTETLKTYVLAQTHSKISDLEKW